MAESTLSLSYADLQAEVSTYLGYGLGYYPPKYTDSPLTVFQQQRVNSCVASGLRNFFFPVPDERTGAIYEFAFLKPTTTLVLPQGVQTLHLPDDFGGIEGAITLLTAKGQLWFPIQVVNEGQIRALYSSTPNVTGRPQCAALQPIKGTTATAGQRWQLFVYPNPDMPYTFQFQYYVYSDFLDGAFPFPMGGMMHAETILESCLAVAEQRQDDMAGIHTENFRTRLMASIAADRRTKAQTLGYNGDNSDRGYWLQDGWNHYQDRITYNGVQYALLFSAFLWHLAQRGVT